MSQTDDLFLREDLGKSENRVNVALFGMMQQDWFRQWFLTKLDLPTDAVVYPPTNMNGYRPDLKVASHDKSTLAWIEVELGTDESQLARYREVFSDPVKAVWGKQSDGGDLSLEEIAKHLEAYPRKDLSWQEAVNAKYLCKMIRDGLDGHKGSLGRDRVSDKMRKNRLVVVLEELLGDRLMFEFGNQPPPIGYLKADTTAASGTNNQGFSLGVRRRDKNGTVALISIRDGKFLIFPSRTKLNSCLPGHGVEVADYMSLVISFGCDVDVEGHNAKPWIRLSDDLDTVLGELDEIAPCLQALADRPGSQ